MSDEDVEALRESWTLDGSTPMSEVPENARTDEVGQQLNDSRENYDQGGLKPDEAVAIILSGVRANQWRILVGPHAIALDEAVRANPVDAYDLDFSDKVWA